jgi:hypothetical protein
MDTNLRSHQVVDIEVGIEQVGATHFKLKAAASGECILGFILNDDPTERLHRSLTMDEIRLTQTTCEAPSREMLIAALQKVRIVVAPSK